MGKALKIIADNRGKRVALYEVGDISSKVINYLYYHDMEKDVEAVFDKNINRVRTNFRGYKVECEDEVVNYLIDCGVEDMKIKAITTF